MYERIIHLTIPILVLQLALYIAKLFFFVNLRKFKTLPLQLLSSIFRTINFFLCLQNTVKIVGCLFILKK